jgi:hypothetical protein
VSANTYPAVPPHATDIIPAAPVGSIDDPPHPPQRVRSHTPLRVSFASTSLSPMPSDDPCPSSQQAPDRADSPTPPPSTDYHIFAVYQRNTAVSSIPDSGATHTLIRETDAEILHSVAPFPPHTRRPQFEVVNGQFIVPIASGFIGFPNTNVTMRAYLFHDHDLADNLFGIALLLRHDYTATFTENDFALHTSSNVLQYSAKAPRSNTWRFSLPRPTDFRAAVVIRHEQHAEMVLFAYATFGSPSYQTFYNAAKRGWLHNYPNLTPDMVHRNQPHVPAYALGHIQASRSGVRSTRTHQTAEEVLRYTPVRQWSHRICVLIPRRANSCQRRVPTRVPVRIPCGRAPIHQAPHYHSPIIKIPRRSPVLRSRWTLPGDRFLRIAVHHDFPVQVLRSRRAPAIPHRVKPRRCIHAHVSILPGPRPPNPVPSLRQRIPRIPCAFLQAATSHCGACAAQPEAREQSRTRDPDVSKSLPLDPRGHPSQLPHQSGASSPAPGGSDPQHDARLARQHGYLRLPWHTSQTLRLSLAPVRNPTRGPRPRQRKMGQSRAHRFLPRSRPHPLSHYRAYHCFIVDTNATRICDSVMFYLAPLVLPGASRFDQLLQLTERLITAAESNPPAPHDQPLYAECLQKLKEFLIADAPDPTPTHNAVPPTASTRHHPSTDLGIDLVGYSFTDRALGQCEVVGLSTYTDKDNNV